MFIEPYFHKLLIEKKTSQMIDLVSLLQYSEFIVTRHHYINRINEAKSKLTNIKAPVFFNQQVCELCENWFAHFDPITKPALKKNIRIQFSSRFDKVHSSRNWFEQKNFYLIKMKSLSADSWKVELKCYSQKTLPYFWTSRKLILNIKTFYTWHFY